MTARFIVESEECARSWDCLTAQLFSDEGECAVIDRAYRFLSDFFTVPSIVLSNATRCVAYDRPYTPGSAEPWPQPASQPDSPPQPHPAVIQEQRGVAAAGEQALPRRLAEFAFGFEDPVGDAGAVGGLRRHFQIPFQQQDGAALVADMPEDRGQP